MVIDRPNASETPSRFSIIEPRFFLIKAANHDGYRSDAGWKITLHDKRVSGELSLNRQSNCAGLASWLSIDVGRATQNCARLAGPLHGTRQAGQLADAPFLLVSWPHMVK